LCLTHGDIAGDEKGAFQVATLARVACDTDALIDVHEVALESAPILKLDVVELDRLNLGDVIGSEHYAEFPESFGDSDLVTDADHHLFGVVDAPFPLAGEVEILPLIFAGKNEHGGVYLPSGNPPDGGNISIAAGAQRIRANFIWDSGSSWHARRLDRGMIGTLKVSSGSASVQGYDVWQLTSPQTTLSFLTATMGRS
jgi:hypothetical protein